jgi:hypothetical protein
MPSRDDEWRSFHEELGLSDPGEYSKVDNLALIAALLTSPFPKPLRRFVKWPVFLFVLLVVLPVAWLLSVPLRLFQRLKRRFANPS